MPSTNAVLSLCGFPVWMLEPTAVDEVDMEGGMHMAFPT